LHDDAARTTRPLPRPRAHSRGAALPEPPRRDQLVVSDRQLGQDARLRATSRLRERQPREGDAPHRLPARDRQPHARRIRARSARSDDHDLVKRRRRQRLLPRGRRGALRSRTARAYDALPGSGLLGERPFQRPGPGALLQPDRQADPGEVARVRARPAVLDRPLPALGLRALCGRRRLQQLLQGRLARDRGRTARARGGALRARREPRLDGGAHGRQPVARIRHRDAPRRGSADLPQARAAGACAQHARVGRHN